MFDNLGTALVQTLGFFYIFVFFVYQTLFADNKPENAKLDPKINKFSDNRKLIKNKPKKAIAYSMVWEIEISGMEKEEIVFQIIFTEAIYLLGSVGKK